MNSIKAILIDDEFSALKVLQQKIERLFPEIEIMGAFQVPEKAIEAIGKVQPDVLFLDVEMPRMNGFELLATLKDITFQIIFVTAYNQYALNALKRSAIDYVLKPIDTDDLKVAVNKTISIINEKSQSYANTKLVALLSEIITKNNKIIIPTSSGMSFVPQNEVLHIEGYDGYTKFHLINDKEIISSYNLGKFEKVINETFFKCHKSHIINLEKVRSFENEGYIVLENNYRVPISKANKKAFLSLFNNS